MRETVRRLLVVALCASTVVALWVVADRSVSAPETAASAPPAASRSVTRAASPNGTGPARTDRTIRSEPVSASASAALSGPTDSRRHNEETRHGSDDTSRPTAVHGIRVIDNSHDSITVRWDPAQAAAGVAYYRVTLNGVPAGETAGLQMTIDWFNDDMTSYFVLVRAVDNRGTTGRRGNPLMVARPAKPTRVSAPESHGHRRDRTRRPTATTTPRPAATPMPIPTPTRTATPSAPVATESPSSPSRPSEAPRPSQQPSR